MFTAVFACGYGLFARDIKLTASVDRNPVALNEQLTYTVQISGKSQSLPEVKLPDFGNFAILSGPNVSTSFQIINFNMTASKTYSVILMPRSVGKFTIPPATVEYKGKTIRSGSIQVTVTRQSKRPAPSNTSRRQRQGRGSSNVDLSRALFLKVVPSKRTVYVNEQVNLVYKIYFKVKIQNPQIVKLPETVGFWVEDYPAAQNIPVTQEVINGIQYNVAEIKQMALFPTRSGDLTITPLEIAVDAVISQRRRDPFSLFDDPFGDFFGRQVRKNLMSKAVRIHVLPLPRENQPANFSGLVGDYRLETRLDKNVVDANQAISLKVKISGTGNLKSLNRLPLKFPSGFQVYDPKVKQSVNRSGRYFSSTKEFEYVLIPRTAGQFVIPSVSIPFFNPFQKKYQWLKTRRFAVKVNEGQGAGAIARSFVPKEQVTLIGKDIHFIKEEKLRLIPVNYRPYATSWFMAALIFPALVLAAAFGFRYHSDKMASNVEYARRRKANKIARERLKEAHQFLKKGELPDFYAAISKGLLGYLADKTNNSAAGIVRDDVEAILVDRNVEPSLKDDLLKLIDEADFRRFAPGEMRAEEAKAFYQKTAELLAKLEKYF